MVILNSIKLTIKINHHSVTQNTCAWPFCSCDTPLLKTLACARCWLSLHMGFVSQGPRHRCYTDHWVFCSLNWSVRNHYLKHEAIHLPGLPSAELWWKQHLNFRQRTPVCECRAQCETCWALCAVLRCCCGVEGSEAHRCSWNLVYCFPNW